MDEEFLLDSGCLCTACFYNIPYKDLNLSSENWCTKENKPRDNTIGCSEGMKIK